MKLPVDHQNDMIRNLMVQCKYLMAFIINPNIHSSAICIGKSSQGLDPAYLFRWPGWRRAFLNQPFKLYFCGFQIYIWDQFFNKHTCFYLHLA